MKLSQLKLKARDVMSTKVTAATRRAIGRDLALQMMSGLYSGLPVVERGGEVIGVVTELDLLRAVLEGKDLQSVKAEDVMGLPALCINEDASIEEVIKQMIEQNIIRLPVVREGKLVGVIARADILRHLVEPEFVTLSGD